MVATGLRNVQYLWVEHADPWLSYAKYECSKDSRKPNDVILYTAGSSNDRISTQDFESKIKMIKVNELRNSLKKN